MFRRFTTCLDSRKTGLRVLENIFKEDSRKYSNTLPECMRSDSDEEAGESDDHIAKKARGRALGPFILDDLQSFGKSIRDNFLGQYEKQFSGELKPLDQHLKRPYQRISEKLSEMRSLPEVKVGDFLAEARRELVTIEEHVKAMRSEWGSIFGKSNVSKRKNSKASQNTAIDSLRRKFVSGPDVPHLALLGDVAEIRASYAYSYKRDSTRFAFAMAFQELCNIKARELGGTTLDREFAELMSIPKSTVRTLSALRASTA